MPDIDRRYLYIGIPIAAIVLVLIGFGIGRATSGNAATVDALSTDGSQTSTTVSEADGSVSETTLAPSTTINGDPSAALPPESELPEGGIPEYGTPDARESMLLGLVESGVTGGTREGVLATADHVCYNLERLEAQGQSPAFAVRVVWNESLLELESEDLAAFAAVFSAAPYYLCPDSIEYGAEVAYWLGY
jgi:hypothetical protein